ncbi:MAG TPA: hypothetical protein VMR19_00950 [Candidatus Saccharimonadales bacterium]|jgi:hypothetical protein|nr:hypothetical protein [Candidatus Saccharimonadales bacterium]
MAVKLNLLPPELSVSKSLGNLLKTVRVLGVIGIAAFLVFTIGIVAYFIFSTYSLNGDNANLTKLKGQVTAQQQSEQQIVLLKDRIDKISAILKPANSLSNLTAVEPTLSVLSDTASINQMAINSTSVDLSVTIQTNSDLSSYLKAFESSDAFVTLNLTSFNLSPKTGYSVEITATKK